MMEKSTNYSHAGTSIFKLVARVELQMLMAGLQRGSWKQLPNTQKGQEVTSHSLAIGCKLNGHLVKSTRLVVIII